MDLADVLSEHGASKLPKLEVVASTIGIPGSRNVDGSMIAALHARGEVDRIRDGCMEDVVQTAFLFLRFELLRGRIDRAEYSRVATELFHAVEADPRANGALAGTDQRLLLLR